jgi:hypothetical protein
MKVVDPIFAAIEKNSTAWAIYNAEHERGDELRAAATASDAASEPLCAVAVNARWGVLDTQPTTTAGLAAKPKFMAEDETEIGFGDDAFANLHEAFAALV